MILTLVLVMNVIWQQKIKTSPLTIKSLVGDPCIVGSIPTELRNKIGIVRGLLPATMKEVSRVGSLQRVKSLKFLPLLISKPASNLVVGFGPNEIRPTQFLRGLSYHKFP